MGCIQSKPAVKDPLPDRVSEDESGLTKIDETLQSQAKVASGRSVDDATAGKSASGRLPSLFSKSRRRDDQGDSTDNGDDKGVESSPREATGIHCLPTGGVRGFKSSQSSASPAGAAAAPTASPTRGEAPAAEEATTPVGPKLIRSKGKIEIMGFEVANVIVRAINLRQSLLERDIEDLRAEVLASEGIRMLVSDDFYHVWCIAAEDKRGELRAVARDVARLGKQCLDPALHSLTQAFDALGTMDGPKGRMTSVEVEGELRALEGQAQITAELYHELANLEQLQQSLDRRVKQDSDSAVNRELIAQMRAEMKAQEKIVKTMKKKGLWSKTMDEVVEKLVQVVIFLHDQIVDVFGADVVKVGRLMSGTPPTAADLRKLGVNGMALQYANIVNMIDTMVMRPACVETQREALFSALPASVCGRLKRTLLQSQDIEQESTESIRQKMEAVLDWLVTMAENTIRFGLDSRVQGHTDLTLLQTLQHVDHLKMERLVLLLLVGLQHLASRSADNDWNGAPAAALSAGSDEAVASISEDFRFPLPKSTSVESQGAAEGASAAAGEAAGGAAGGGGGGKEAESAVVPPISLSRARRSLSESVPTVGDWETLPRRIAAMEEEEKARAEEGASDSAAAEGLGGGETGRPRSAGLEAGAVDAAGSAEPPVWRQVRQASLTDVSLEPVPEVEVMEGEEGEGEGEEEGEGEKGEREEGEEEEEEVHKKEKDDLLTPLASKTVGGSGSRPSSSSGKLVPAAAAATAAAAGAAGTSASAAENAESPAAAARRALASGMGTSRKSLENALRMGGNAGKRPVDASGAFGSLLDRSKLPGSAAGSGPPLAGEALLAAMTMSQGFGPAARGAASEEMMEAMREATYGRSRSHTFAMAARPEPNPRFFTKSLSRYSLLRRMEAEEAGGGGAGGVAGSSSTGGGSIFVAPQRFLPMTPATVDVDRIHDVKPDLDLTSVAAPRLGGRLV
ncbi:unnamed protein product [Closterium sp. Naga37s-1]|nr:unnamed protein product [Closterium sp. Naga37s-1]